MNTSYNHHFKRDRFKRLSWALAVATGLLIIGMLSSCEKCSDYPITHEYVIDLTFQTGTVQRRVLELPKGSFVYSLEYGWCYLANDKPYCRHIISPHADRLEVVSIQQLDKTK